ncbi:hypothetical protein EV401DRAFT_2075672 [Pisolithus croceorrhizus]|nr:hypothetical protein EV401DRAFT_2075672 [Pisolithus croceorrhizus]
MYYLMLSLPITPESMMNQSPAADQALSVFVDIALSSVLWGSPLTPSSVLQRSDLQKPRLRVRSQEFLPPASFSSMELQLSALVFAFAILNPYVTEWDIDRFAEPKRNVRDKIKYLPYPQWGHISDPATILDVHGRVVVWYLPGIMSPARVEHLNNIHLPLKDSLVKCSKTGGQSKRRFGHRHVPEGDGNEMFGHGHLMNSPATFQQAHMRLEDKVYESSSLRKAPDAISAKEDWVVTQPPAPIRWSSIYLGIDVIVNQETPPHLDQVSAPSLLDLVVSLGTHDAKFHISELGTIFHYQPGTMIYLAGELLTHSVPKWETGERIALAHYMKDAVHNRFGLARPAFTTQKDLLGIFLQT